MRSRSTRRRSRPWRSSRATAAANRRRAASSGSSCEVAAQTSRPAAGESLRRESEPGTASLGAGPSVSVRAATPTVGRGELRRVPALAGRDPFLELLDAEALLRGGLPRHHGPLELRTIVHRLHDRLLLKWVIGHHGG